MRALEHRITAQVVVFASSRYWPDETELLHAYAHVRDTLTVAYKGLDMRFLLVRSADDLNEQIGGAILLVPLSGGVQEWMLYSAHRGRAVGVLPAYVPGPISAAIARTALERNAAPAAVEVWSLLKREDRLAIWVEKNADFVQLGLAVQAVERLGKLRLLLLGGPEAWVQSSERDLGRLGDNLGVGVTTVPLRVLEDYARRVSTEAALEHANAWRARADQICEPVESDIIDACRVELGLREMLDFYDADGAAVACFSLIADMQTTACLALASLNGSADRIGACEGDIDAAVTLALAKAISESSVWMANPIIGRDDTVMFTHCTAPVNLSDSRPCLCLRSHHESGMGVSPELDLWMDKNVTIVRIGNGSSAISIFSGHVVDGGQLSTCRTQLRVRMPSHASFLGNLLGNHQILLAGDWHQAFEFCADLLGLDCYQSDASLI